MIKREMAMVPTQEVKSIICDRCEREYDSGDWENIQEFLHFDIVGGYGSAWGDMVEVRADICSKCQVALFKDFVRIE